MKQNLLLLVLGAVVFLSGCATTVCRPGMGCVEESRFVMYDELLLDIANDSYAGVLHVEVAGYAGSTEVQPGNRTTITFREYDTEECAEGLLTFWYEYQEEGVKSRSPRTNKRFRRCFRNEHDPQKYASAIVTDKRGSVHIQVKYDS